MPKALFPTLFLVYVLLSACVKNQDINAPTIRVGPKINLYQGSLGHDNHAVVKTEGQNLMICGSREGKLLLFSINDKGVERFYEEVIFEGITFAQGILQLDNNDFLVTGHRKAENEPGYLQVHKFNQYGKRLWTTRFKSHFIKWGKAIVTLKDSSMYVVSAPEKSAYNLFLNKFDNNGNLKWSKEFKLNYDRIKFGNIIRSFDNQLILATSIQSGNPLTGKEINIFKLDTSGNEVWKKTLEPDNFAEASSIIELENKKLVVCGYSKTNSGSTQEAYVALLSNKGEPIWEKKIGTDSLAESAKSIIFNEDNTLTVMGSSFSPITGFERLLLFNIDVETG